MDRLTEIDVVAFGLGYVVIDKKIVGCNVLISEWPNFLYVAFTNNAGGPKENILTILMFGFMGSYCTVLGRFLFTD